MIEELRNLISKEIQANAATTPPKTVILKVEKEKNIIKLSKPSK